MLSTFSEELMKMAAGEGSPNTMGVDEAKQRAIARARFRKIHKVLKEKSVDTGAALTRISVPKSALSEKDVRSRLGFVPVKIAVPEVGQKRFETFRHPMSGHHIHDHGDTWVIHYDKHPSTTMLWHKKSLKEQGKLKGVRPPHKELRPKDPRTTREHDPHTEGGTENVPSYLQGTLKGMTHLMGEGVPGMASWTRSTLSGAKGMKERVSEKMDPTEKRRMRQWKARPSYVPKVGDPIKPSSFNVTIPKTASLLSGLVKVAKVMDIDTEADNSHKEGTGQKFKLTAEGRLLGRATKGTKKRFLATSAVPRSVYNQTFTQFEKKSSLADGLCKIAAMNSHAALHRYIHGKKMSAGEINRLKALGLIPRSNKVRKKSERYLR